MVLVPTSKWPRNEAKFLIDPFGIPTHCIILQDHSFIKDYLKYPNWAVTNHYQIKSKVKKEH